MARYKNHLDSQGNHLVPFLEWEPFLKKFKWKQGEHLTSIGMTGCGKTTLLRELLERRNRIVTFSTKSKDDTMDSFKKRGFVEQKELDLSYHRKIILKPKLPKNPQDIEAALQFNIANALTKLYNQRGWCIYLDEVRYITRNLRLHVPVEMLLTQGRSAGLTVVCGTQRPKLIPLECYDQATHLFFFKDTDDSNLKRISGMAFDPQIVRDQVRDLGDREVLYICKRPAMMVRTRQVILGTG